jgi:hypothetical protein
MANGGWRPKGVCQNVSGVLRMPHNTGTGGGGSQSSNIRFFWLPSCLPSVPRFTFFWCCSRETFALSPVAVVIIIVLLLFHLLLFCHFRHWRPSRLGPNVLAIIFLLLLIGGGENQRRPELKEGNQQTSKDWTSILSGLLLIYWPSAAVDNLEGN